MNQRAAQESRFFYGWIIVGVSTLALIVSNGLSIGGIPVFFKHIQNDLLQSGAVTLQTKDAVTGNGAALTAFLAGLFSLFTGFLIERFRIKTLMIAGCFVLGGGLLIYSQAAAPWQIYLAHSLFGISLGLVGVMINAVLISNWFRRRRGAAMGIVLTGTSFGAVLVSLASRPLIDRYGWRMAMLILSVLVWLVLLPAVLFLVRDKASDLNLNYDGLPNEENQLSIGNSQAAAGLNFSQALKTSRFWLLAILAASIFYPIFATAQQFILHIQSPRIGVNPEIAAFAQSAIFATSVAGKFFFGWLSDKFETPRVMLVCCSIMFAATLLHLGLLNANTLFLYLIPFGLGYGGTFVLIQQLTIENFGLRDIGKILGAITFIETLGGTIGLTVTGRLASAADGDYTTAFYGVTIAAGLSLLAVAALNFQSNQKPAIS